VKGGGLISKQDLNRKKTHIELLKAEEEAKRIELEKELELKKREIKAE
jgi:hypothetical protein